MQNIKYHALNSLAVLVFSYVFAITVNQIYRHITVPAIVPGQSGRQAHRVPRRSAGFDDYRAIIDSSFFKVAPFLSEGGPGLSVQASIIPESELQLMGTISGSRDIARALIKKKAEPEAKIYRVGNDVFGYRLTSIHPSKVHLRIGKDIRILELYSDKDKEPGSRNTPARAASRTSPGSLKQNLSRAELQQTVFKNIDNALKGLRAGPYRVDGKIEGYKIFNIRPYNVLYKLGARPGDVIRKVNGHPIDSTEKLYQLWGSVKTDSRITVDLERNRQQMTYEFNITD